MAKVIIGIIALALGIWGIWSWWGDFGLVMRGFVPIALLFFGLLFIGSNYYQRKSSENKTQ